MDALPYVDSLFKEYLLFRGFTATLQTFNQELAADKAGGFQAERITELIFRKLIPELQVKELVDFLDFLNIRFYSRLDMKFESTCRRMEVSVLRCLLVKAVKLNRRDKVAEFFQLYGTALLSAKDPEDWRPWFCLAYVLAPNKDPNFQVYFTSEWVEVLEVSYRNFISEVLRILPLPAVLRFNTDRLARQQLQQQVDALQSEIRSLQQQQQLLQATHSLSSASSLSSDAQSSFRRTLSGSRRGQSQGEESGEGEGGFAARPTGAQAGDGALAALSRRSSFNKVRTKPDLPVVHEQDTRQRPPDPSPTTPPSQSPHAPQPRPAGHHKREASLADWTDVDEAGPDLGRVGMGPSLSAASVRRQASAAGESVDLRPGSASVRLDSDSRGSLVSHEVLGTASEGGPSDPPTPTAMPSPDPSKPAAALSSPHIPSFTHPQPHPSTPTLPPTQPLPSSTAPASPPPTTLAPAASDPAARRALSDGGNGSTSSSGRAAGGAAGSQGSAAYALLDNYVRATQVSPRRTLEGEADWEVEAWADAAGAGSASSDAEREAPAGDTHFPGTPDGPQTPSPQAGTPLTPPDPQPPPSSSAVSASSPLHNGSSGRLPGDTPLEPLGWGSEGVVRGSRWELVLRRDDAFMEHCRPVTACKLSPAGANCASASDDGAVSIWMPPRCSGDPSRNTSLNIGACVSALTWDERADKIMLLGTCGKGVKAWHADTKRMTADIPCDPQWPDVLDVACCPTEPSFVCSHTGLSLRGGTASMRGRVTLWNMRSFRKVQTFMIPGDPVATCVCYSRSGRLVATACAGGKVNIFDTTGGRAQPEKSWQVGPAGSRVFARFLDATLLTFCGGKVQEWALQGARAPIRTFDLSSVCSDSGPVVAAANCHRFAVSPDQSMLAATTDTGDLAFVDLHDTANQQKNISLLKLGMPGGVCSVDWHPSEDMVVCGSVAGPISALTFERQPITL